uniref:FHA domain-containing protein n=1 Tax=Attheya septentrionalis TaxID=420275 RepID=A0A7S2UR41_9STRA|mmetsp:Transcript_8912/g.16217  ORF Transcript_8912/g.16217 Transcript_8912/m.16217 type:complete len:611 (+) Transcript_8912:152-1984(+)
MEYTFPKWAEPPKEDCEWSVEEIKNGVVLATYELKGACTTMGRASTELPTAHESCSRLHARIAFDGMGVPWLRDLGSAHGTRVNRRALPPQAVGRSEDGTGTGSRGVIVYPGDLIQLGESTRSYCLVGPPSYERGAKIPPMDSTKQSHANAAANKIDTTPLSEEDAEHDHDDNDDVTKNSGIPLDQLVDQIPDKHRKAYDKWMAKQYKLANLQTESQRIQNKASVEELSAGQTRQLERNTERSQELQRELENMEQELRQKIFGKPATGHGNTAGGSKKRRRGQDNEEYSAEDDDVDDFYDRTRDDAREREDGLDQEETEQSLTAKWGSLHSSLQRCEFDMARSQHQLSKLEARTAMADEEDVFFLKNDLQLAKEAQQKAQKAHDAIQFKLSRVEKLLMVVNHRLVFDRKLGIVSDKSSLSKAVNMEASSAQHVAPHVVPKTSGNGLLMLPPPAKQMKLPSTLSTSTNVDELTPRNENTLVESSFSMPPPRPKQNEGPMPPPSTIVINKNMLPPPIRVKPKPQLPERPNPNKAGTMSFLQSSSSTSRKERMKGPHVIDSKVIALQSSSDASAADDTTTPTTIDLKKDEWRAPKGQDGSGITKLNAKFAGRY